MWLRMHADALTEAEKQHLPSVSSPPRAGKTECFLGKAGEKHDLQDQDCNLAHCVLQQI